MRAPRNWPGAVFTNDHGISWTQASLGPDPDLYQPRNWRAAADINVAALRQIYIWPLTAQAGDGRDDPAPRGYKALTHSIARAFAAATADDPSALVRVAAQELCAPGSNWTEIDDLFDHLNPKLPAPQHAPSGSCQCKYCAFARADEAQRYAEFVYFHDFVQKILFRKPQAPGETPAVRLFRHTRIKRVEITVAGKVYAGTVHRANFYMIDTGAAALVVEVEFEMGSALNLAEAQSLTERARRSFTAYFAPHHDFKAAGVPDRWRWLEADNTCFGTQSTPAALQQDLAFIRQHRTAPVAAHWQTLLQPLAIAGARAGARMSWRHLADERIPVMSFVSLTGAAEKLGLAGMPVTQMQKEGWGPVALATQMDLSLVSRGDWVRLCHADDQGSDPLPYSPAIFRKFEKTACYDRYFPSDVTTTSVRYMFAGYHFSVVGAGGFFDATLVHHFRRHYFQIGLVVTMELASMLALSSRVSEAVRTHRSVQGRDPKAVHEFRRKMLGIQETFLQLTHIYVFSGLSNQLQPTEMHEKWRKALNLDSIFDDLENEIEAATTFITAERQAEQSEISNHIAMIAVIGVVIGLALSLSQVLGAAPGAFAKVLGHLVETKGDASPSFTLPGLGFILSASVCGLSTLALLILGSAAIWNRWCSSRAPRLAGWRGSAQARALWLWLLLMAAISGLSALYLGWDAIFAHFRGSP